MSCVSGCWTSEDLKRTLTTRLVRIATVYQTPLSAETSPPLPLLSNATLFFLCPSTPATLSQQGSSPSDNPSLDCLHLLKTTLSRT
jgi:hypothetical protein